MSPGDGPDSNHLGSTYIQGRDGVAVLVVRSLHRERIELEASGRRPGDPAAVLAGETVIGQRACDQQGSSLGHAGERRNLQSLLLEDEVGLEIGGNVPC